MKCFPLAAALCGIACGQSTPRLVKDINPTPYHVSLSIERIAEADGRIFFHGYRNGAGSELWSSNGTPAGTAMVRDLLPGVGFGSASAPLGMGGHVYYAGDGGSEGTGLWRSDGTAAGTTRVKEFSFLDSPRRPVPVVATSTHLWFTTIGGWQRDTVLWATDGTEQGTVELNPMVIGDDEILPYRRLVGPSHFTGMSGELYFVANQREIWRSNGTAEGTSRVASIPGEWNLEVLHLVAGNGVLYATTREGDWTGKVWQTNGTPGNLETVEKTETDPSWGLIVSAAMAGDTLCFAELDSTYGSAVWTTDGTTNRRIERTAIASGGMPGDFVSAGGIAYFTCTADGAGRELWRTDGTEQGTSRVADLDPGTGEASFRHLTPCGGLLYFTRQNNGLWCTDGTESGTRRVTPESWGIAEPEGLLAIGGQLSFHLNSWDSLDGLWITDGTTVTHLARAEQVTLSGVMPHQPGGTATARGRVYFTGTDGIHGEELWVSDGTARGTRMIRDIRTGPDDGFPHAKTVLGNKLLFVARTEAEKNQVWSCHTGTGAVRRLTNFPTAGQGALPRDFTVAGKLCYFDAGTPDGSWMWQTNGTPKGTREVRTATGERLQRTGELVALGKTLYFIAGASFSDGDLWRTDGTPRGTRRVKEIPKISWSNWIHGLVTPGNRLAFFVDDGLTTGLWTSDGTEAGTVAVRDFVSVTHSTRLGGLHLFVADDGIHGHEWWRSDGTPQGTRMIQNLVAAGGIGDENTAHESCELGGQLYFTADDGILGKELWRTDGTAIFPVVDLFPGTAGSHPGELTVASGRLWFSANDGVHGRELWSTDGTPAGTFMTAETMVGPAPSSPAGLVAVGNRLFYAAESPGIGVELHVLDLTAPKPPAARGGRSARMAGQGSPAPDEEAMLRSAFNLPAGASSRVLVESGTSGFPRFAKAGDRFRVEFLRCRDGRYRYTPKCSPSLEPDSFVPMTTEESVTVIDDLWERVVVSETIPADAPRMFGVVEVTAP